MAFSSALFFVVFLFKDLGELVRTSWSDVPWALLVRYLASMGLAGGLVGFALSGLLGRRGLGGWALAVVAGAVAATAAGLLGSLFGGLPDIVANGLDGQAAIAIGAGALVLPFAMSDWPLLLLIWLVLLAITHLWIRRRRHPSGS
jgi:hypothetical protein